jgi:hypothetical protein
MALTEARSDQRVVTSLGPAARTATTNGTGVDTAGAGQATFHFLVGTITDGTHTPKLQDSADDSAYADVAAADQVGTLAALASNTNQKASYIGGKRYVRAVSTVAGATTGGVYAAIAVLTQNRKQP